MKRNMSIKYMSTLAAIIFILAFAYLKCSITIVTTNYFILGAILFLIFLLAFVVTVNYNYKLKGYIDPQTNIYTTHKFQEDLKEIDKNNTEAVLYLCDIDGLKQVNDTYGHKVGDLLIKYFAFSLKELGNKYPNLTAYRIYTTGDEFAVIITKRALHDNDGAELALKAICNHIAVEVIIAGTKEKHITSASFGSAMCYGKTPNTTERAIEIADSCMYELKRQKKQAVR